MLLAAYNSKNLIFLMCYVSILLAQQVEVVCILSAVIATFSLARSRALLKLHNVSSSGCMSAKCWGGDTGLFVSGTSRARYTIAATDSVVKQTVNKWMSDKTWGSHGSEYENNGLPVCDAVNFGIYLYQRLWGTCCISFTVEKWTYSEQGSKKFLRNSDTYPPKYSASYPVRPESS